MARRKSDIKSKHFSPASAGSKRKAEDISPLRKSTRVRKTVLLKEKLQESGSEDEGDGTDYKEESQAEVEDENESDDSDGNHSVTIPLPKARTAGERPYDDGQIHPNTFLFLADLKANNNREWLKWNDKDFRNSQKDFHSFVEKLSELIIEKDDTIPELPIKDLIFRIYRDVRFSNDPTPYKVPPLQRRLVPYWQKGPYAAYYLQIIPGGESFIGGGLWHPEGSVLAKIRDDIDEHPHRIKRALMNENLRNTFFAGAKGNEKKVVAAFIAGNAESALKTKPKVYISYSRFVFHHIDGVPDVLQTGYDADHKDIDLLRLKNFTMVKKIPDKDVLSDDAVERIADVIGGLVPWITYLNRTVMPDRNQAGSDDDDEDEDEDEDE